MVDFQVVFPQEVVQLTSVRTVPGVSPRMIDVFGADFRAVDEVQINDMVSPNLLVVSRTRLLAEVPAAVGAVIQSVMVVSRQLTVTPRSVIRFKIGRTPSKVSGILRLVQVFLKILLTTPGTDIFAQRVGGDALKNLGQTFGKAQSGGIVSDFVLSIETTKRQILAIQGRDPTLPRDERLLAASVSSASYSQQESGLFVAVEIVSQAGQAALTNILV